ncbi:PIG-L deacetylase family protein [Actinokineospora spheciospongiae]|uniref:PIG-L deacetylase family protein n=1 Tax=Actinokineospora spheciospongiae TaxID=909613 RepID=UPI000D711497|nr:PIG-L family deacetylase [Actinokineospora spheciospongiae]PWW64690.1 LmbE family N-acetylglucosaminyl deacetylase [Actinokineospora spheciospongiae]
MTTPSTTPDLRGHTAVVLHAHPDDEAIFTGITMRRLADAGARVVLVCATDGDLGEALIPLRPHETLAGRRLLELERAGDILGVDRLVLLGFRDSGLPGWPQNHHPMALMRQPVGTLSRRVAEIIEAEQAEMILHYDWRGIYRHPDHVAVHRIGRQAARLAGVTSYEATVDRTHLTRLGDNAHLVHAAARSTDVPFGLFPSEITVTLRATYAELSAKLAAIVTHASQVTGEAVAHATFPDAYRFEWYQRIGPPTVLEALTAEGIAVGSAPARP